MWYHKSWWWNTWSKHHPHNHDLNYDLYMDTPKSHFRHCEILLRGIRLEIRGFWTQKSLYTSNLWIFWKKSHLHHPQTVRIDSKWSRLIWSSPHTSAYARFKRIYGHLCFNLGLQVMWVRLYLSSSPWKSIELRLSIYSLWSSSTCSKVK